MIMLPFLTNVLDVSWENIPLRNGVFALLKCFSNKFEQAESYFLEWISNFMLLNAPKKPPSLLIGLEVACHVMISS